jgi:hypothetical protein
MLPAGEFREARIAAGRLPPGIYDALAVAPEPVAEHDYRGVICP